MIKEITIWTEAYRPFILGGNVNAPIGTIIEVDDLDLADLGQGYQGWIVEFPFGKTFVIESSTGGIIGTSERAVRMDIISGDPLVIKQQIENAMIRKNDVELVPNFDFWAYLDK